LGIGSAAKEKESANIAIYSSIWRVGAAPRL